VILLDTPVEALNSFPQQKKLCNMTLFVKLFADTSH